MPFEFCLYRADDTVTPADPRWQWSMPMERKEILGAVPPHDTDHQPTVGDYFSAVVAFLDGPARKPLLGALAHQQKPSATLNPFPVRITLEKHGAFYHPARVEIATQSGTAAFAVNVALSDSGAAALRREYHTLARLGAKTTRTYLPAVYALADHKTARWPMFMAQWLDGYHEFHLSHRPDHTLGIKLWRPSGPSFLSPAQAVEIYRQAANVLTRFYDPFSFKQIFPWHMAAGDFVVGVRSHTLNLRMITARAYQPLIEGAPANSFHAILEGLLDFFLHMTLRLRLDRLDGTGPLVWAPACALEGALVGFFEAAGRLAVEDPRLEDLPLAIAYALSRLSPSQFEGRLAAICTAWTPATTETSFLVSRLKAHAKNLGEVLSPFFIDKSTR